MVELRWPKEVLQSAGGKMEVAAKESLQQQTIAINCAIEDANYAVANDKNLRDMAKR